MLSLPVQLLLGSFFAKDVSHNSGLLSAAPCHLHLDRFRTDTNAADGLVPLYSRQKLKEGFKLMACDLFQYDRVTQLGAL